MLGDFITRTLVLLFGYAYPAFECFKTVEKNRVEMDELRFWCQYWIIVALMTVFERIGDIFVSWLPMYGEMKLALIIYLWYPKTKGTGFVYEMLRPYVARHETDIDRKVEEYRARAWDFAIYYWQNCTQLGQTTFFQVLQYFASQSTKFTNPKSKLDDDRFAPSAPPVPEPSPPSFSTWRHRSAKPKSPPSPTATVNRSVFRSPDPDHVQIQPPQAQTELLRAGEAPAAEPTSPIDEKLHAARRRLRRSKPL